MTTLKNGVILSKIFKEDLIGKITFDGTTTTTTTTTDVAEQNFITTPWFNNLFLVFMYLEKNNDDKNTVFSACSTATEPKDVDVRRTLYYAKFIGDKMELLSKKGFTTENFVKIRSLVEGLRAAATATDKKAIIDYLNLDNTEINQALLDDVIKLNTTALIDNTSWNTANEIFGGKKNKSSKQRKYRKNKSSRKH